MSTSPAASTPSAAACLLEARQLVELVAHAVAEAVHVAARRAGMRDRRRVPVAREEGAGRLLESPAAGAGRAARCAARSASSTAACARWSAGGGSPTQKVRVQSANSAPRGKRSTISDSPARSTRSSRPVECGTAPSSPGATMFPSGCASPCRGENRPRSRRASRPTRSRSALEPQLAALGAAAAARSAATPLERRRRAARARRRSPRPRLRSWSCVARRRSSSPGQEAPSRRLEAARRRRGPLRRGPRPASATRPGASRRRRAPRRAPRPGSPRPAAARAPAARAQAPRASASGEAGRRGLVALHRGEVGEPRLAAGAGDQQRGRRGARRPTKGARSGSRDELRHDRAAPRSRAPRAAPRGRRRGAGGAAAVTGARLSDVAVR